MHSNQQTKYLHRPANTVLLTNQDLWPSSSNTISSLTRLKPPVNMNRAAVPAHSMNVHARPLSLVCRWTITPNIYNVTELIDIAHSKNTLEWQTEALSPALRQSSLTETWFAFRRYIMKKWLWFRSVCPNCAKQQFFGIKAAALEQCLPDKWSSI